MKTWQVIKALTENPKLKFRIVGSESEGNILVNSESENGIKFLSDKCSAFLSPHLLRQEWEQVKEPVSFMEAVQAFEQNKVILCKFYDSEPYKYYRNTLDSTCLRDIKGGVITTEEILKGKWYIEG